VQLLSPRAEVRLLLCGGTGLLKHARLQHIALALRSLLVLEMRDVQVSGAARLPAAPRCTAAVPRWRASARPPPPGATRGPEPDARAPAHTSGAGSLPLAPSTLTSLTTPPHPHTPSRPAPPHPQVTGVYDCEPGAHVPDDVAALTCHLATLNGADARAVLAGPPDVLATPELVVSALRRTLVGGPAAAAAAALLAWPAADEPRPGFCRPAPPAPVLLLRG
jgi:hypothetical protein